MSNKLTFFVPPFKVMLEIVFAIRTKNHKILKSVVISDTVNMMHRFVGLEKTPEMFFHNKSVFSNVPILRGVGMFWLPYCNVTKEVVNSTILIVTTTFGMFSPESKVAGVSTIELFFAGFNKLFRTVFTYSFHNLSIDYYG